MKDYVTVALAKGRLGERGMQILNSCGIRADAAELSGRQLQFTDAEGKYRFLAVKPADVPTYVEHGVADMGMVGYDTILEEDKDVYEMLDLKFGSCKICIAGFPTRKQAVTSPSLRVATKYVNIAKKFFAERGENAEIIKLNGSVELGPVVGLSDVILDIVESGKTLQANGLVVLEEICLVTARLIVNKVSLKTKRERLQPLIDRIGEIVK